MAFFGIQILQNSISAGAPTQTLLMELTTLPMSPSRLGRGLPLFIFNPVDAFGLSLSMFLASRLGAFGTEK